MSNMAAGEEIFEAVHNIGIRQLLVEVHSGATVLPDFQRDFVWPTAATQNLLVSVVANFPAGSLLRARDRARAFSTRRIEGAPSSNHLHTFLLLDGQQRLTSLYQALYGLGGYQFFIDLKMAIQNPSLDDQGTIFSERTNSRWVTDRINNLALQAEEMILPLSVLYKPEGFSHWSRTIRDYLPEDQKRTFEENMDKLYDNTLVNFHTYQFPVVTLKESIPTEALCTIFETLNMRGIKLTMFELMTARFYKWINLRELWDTAESENPIIKEYEIEGYSAIQALSLLVKGSCQKKDLLSLTERELKDNWQLTVDSIVRGLIILRDDCKIMSPNWLPTPSMVGPLAAICGLSERDNPRGPVIASRKQKIVRWIWCAIFSQRYEAAANTRADRDVKDMKKWFDDDLTPEMIEQFRFDEQVLREVYTKSSSTYKGVICLILASSPQPIDFHNGGHISKQMLISGDVEDHHIFPSNYLKTELGVEKRSLRDCVLNRTLINKLTNRVISDKAPSIYLETLDGQIDTDSVLKTHLLPVGKTSPLRTNDYEEFLTQRTKLISAAILAVTS